jgi:hypothetical protein
MAQANILKTLLAATKVDRKGKNEDDQTFFERVAGAAADDLPEEEWDKLSELIQTWVNTAIKALNDGKEIPDPATFKAGDASTDDDDAPADDGEDEEDGDGAEEEPADEAEDDPDAEGDNEENDDMTDETETKTNKRKAPAKKKSATNAPAAKADKAPAKKKAAPAKKAADKGSAPAAKAKPAKKAATSGGARGTGAQVFAKRAMIANPALSLDDLMKKLDAKGLKATIVSMRSIRAGVLNTLKIMHEMGVLGTKVKFTPRGASKD